MYTATQAYFDFFRNIWGQFSWIGFGKPAILASQIWCYNCFNKNKS